MKNSSNNRIVARAMVALGSAALVAGACGGDGESRAPVLRVLADQVLVSNAVGSPGSQSSASRMSMLAFYDFQVAGALSEFGGPGPAYVIEPAEPTTDQLNLLAAAFGIADPFEEQSPDFGGGLLAGPTDGTSSMISVMDDVMSTWSYSPAWADSVLESCVTPVDEGTGEVSSACAPTGPPENVPSKDEARQMFDALVDELGVDSSNLAVEIVGDEWGVTVTGYLKIAGVRSPFAWSATYGENGSVASAFGVLNDSVSELGDYPRLTTEQALDRLRAEQLAIAADAGLDPDSGLVTTLESVEEELYILYGADGEVYLVPGYSFIGRPEGGYTPRFIVSALPEDFVESVPVSTGGSGTTGVEVPSSDVTVDDGSLGGGPVGELPAEIPLDRANELLGLTEDEAVAYAESQGWGVRIAARDGEQFALTMDYSPTRVNLTIEGGFVTYVFVG